MPPSRAENVQLSYFDSLRKVRVESGLLYISGTILQAHGHAAVLLEEILAAKRGGAEHLTILINSHGGEITEALAMHDLIVSANVSGASSTTIAIGSAASAACMVVLQAGERRLATPNARFMLHEISRYIREGSAETTSQSEENAREMKALQERMLALLAKRIGKTPREITKFVGRKDKYLTPEEALAFGLIDGIEPQVI